MQIRDRGEALYIACEMERRAIRLYERALAVFADGPCQEAIRSILADEMRHLAQFRQMSADAPDFERAQLLAAQASELLFSGGLTEAQRKGAFESVQRLYAYAAQEEKDAVRQYGEFAAALTGETAAAFQAIQAEETSHLLKLNDMIRALSLHSPQ